MDTVAVPQDEYFELKKKAELSDELLTKLVRGLEDIKAGRVKPWKFTS